MAHTIDDGTKVLHLPDIIIIGTTKRSGFGQDLRAQPCQDCRGVPIGSK